MRALIYDRTCDGRAGGMSKIWSTGAALYRKLGRIDAVYPAESWAAALAWIATLTEPLDELQFWGHGKWGAAYIDRDVLDRDALTGPLRAGLEALRDRLAPDPLIWFRTCETFGARRGIDFAERLADFTGARVAGHTFVIHFHQSGLHGLAPGARADWSAEEGLVEGTPDEPRKARWSVPWATHTITSLANHVPERWFSRGAPAS